MEKEIVQNVATKLQEIVDIICSNETLFHKVIMLENHSNLSLTLLGGTITFLTLYFALIPTLLEKKKDDYYLGRKITDYFLHKRNGRVELLQSWKMIVILLVVDIVFCVFKGYGCSLLFSITIIIFIAKKTYKYLKFIVDQSVEKELISNEVETIIKNDEWKIIEELVSNSADSIELINENIDFLLSLEDGSRYTSEYINRLFEVKSNHREYILLHKLPDVIKEHEYTIKFEFDNHLLYRFLRNSINDQNKEEYYTFIYLMIQNNYNCYKINKTKYNDINYLNFFIQVIDDSYLSQNNKIEFQKRIIRNLGYITYQDKKLGLADEYYYPVYKYIFDFLKEIIDQDNYILFECFVNEYDDIDNGQMILQDIYTTCEIYLYYLIEFENEKYVNKDSKDIYIKMKKKLEVVYNFGYISIFDYYRANLAAFTNALKEISTWWDRMNTEEMKTCIAHYAIDDAIKCFHLIFNVGRYDDEYRFNDEIIALFRDDITQGSFKAEKKEKYIRFFDFMEYSYDEELFSRFAEQYTTFVVENYKDAELDRYIDKTLLKNLIDRDITNSINTINESNIFTNDNCEQTIEKRTTLYFDMNVLSEHYMSNAILSSRSILKYIEWHIFGYIKGLVKYTTSFTYDKYDELLKLIKGFKNDAYYFKPSFDILERQRKSTNEYKEELSRFKLIESNHQIPIRLLVENYYSKFKSIKCIVEEVGEEYITREKERYRIEGDDSTFCKENKDFVEIIYSDSEICELIKNTHAKVTLIFEFGIEVGGDNNLAFVLENDN